MHGAARFFTAVSDWANKGSEWLLALLAGLMVLDIGLQVFCRYVLNNSLFWSEELGRMLLVWLTFVGAAVAYKRKAHMGVDVLTSRLSLRWRRRVEVLVTAVCMVFFGVMAWHGWVFFGFIKFQSTAALGVSAQIPFAALPLSGALMFLHGAARLAGLWSEGQSTEEQL